MKLKGVITRVQFSIMVELVPSKLDLFIDLPDSYGSCMVSFTGTLQELMTSFDIQQDPETQVYDIRSLYGRNCIISPYKDGPFIKYNFLGFIL